MKITVLTKGFDLTPAIDSFTKAHLLGALEDFGADILSVDVFLSDTNGPRGGADKQVLLRVDLSQRLLVTVKSTREDLYVALAVGARRARRSVRRTLRKARRLEKKKLRQLRLSQRFAQIEFS